MEEAIEQIVSYLKHSAQGLEEQKQILYLLGPVGGGKSSLAEKLKSLMQEMPSDWKQIQMILTLQCTGTKSSYTGFRTHDRAGWSTNNMRLTEINSLSNMTITVNIKI